MQGEWSEAQKRFKNMIRRGSRMRAPIVTINTIMAAYMKQGMFDQVQFTRAATQKPVRLHRPRLQNGCCQMRCLVVVMLTPCDPRQIGSCLEICVLAKSSYRPRGESAIAPGGAGRVLFTVERRSRWLQIAKFKLLRFRSQLCSVSEHILHSRKPDEVRLSCRPLLDAWGSQVALHMVSNKLPT